MKSSPPAKPPRWGAVQRGPLGGGGVAVPGVPGSVLRARRSEVMN
ncbi:mCG1026318 [Mus musculus]|nr:mCG1026318 [Mus musculus]